MMLVQYHVGFFMSVSLRFPCLGGSCLRSIWLQMLDQEILLYLETNTCSYLLSWLSRAKYGIGHETDSNSGLSVPRVAFLPCTFKILCQANSWKCIYEVYYIYFVTSHFKLYLVARVVVEGKSVWGLQLVFNSVIKQLVLKCLYN